MSPHNWYYNRLNHQYICLRCSTMVAGGGHPDTFKYFRRYLDQRVKEWLPNDFKTHDKTEIPGSKFLDCDFMVFGRIHES